MMAEEENNLLLISFIGSCQNRIYNPLNQTHLFIQTNSTHSLISIILSGQLIIVDIVGIISIILNILSWLVFIKWPKNAMRTLLLFLSFTEIGMNVFCILYHYIYEQNPTLLDSQTMGFSMVIFWIICQISWFFGNSFIIMRNWSVVLIAFARWEAIRFPLKVKKIAEGKSLILILGVIFVISLCYGFIRLLGDKIILCLDTQEFRMEHFLDTEEFYNKIFLNVGFLVLQGFGPVLAVLGLSIALIYQIRMAQRHLNSFLEVDNNNNNNSSSNNNNR